MIRNRDNNGLFVPLPGEKRGPVDTAEHLLLVDPDLCLIVEKQDSIVISQFTLKEVVRQTIFSISDNENNKLMTGELFEIKGDEMQVVSSDGHRISIRKIRLRAPSITVSIPRSISFAVNVIIPFVASTRMHSRMDMVVLLGTALETVCRPLSRFDLEHIQEEGIIALDAKIFLEIVRKLPENDIKIESDPSFKTNITCEKANFMYRTPFVHVDNVAGFFRGAQVL